MYVIYRGELWQLHDIRGTFFERIKESNPDLFVKISKSEETKRVKIYELIDHSVWRNT